MGVRRLAGSRPVDGRRVESAAGSTGPGVNRPLLSRIARRSCALGGCGNDLAGRNPVAGRGKDSGECLTANQRTIAESYWISQERTEETENVLGQ